MRTIKQKDIATYGKKQAQTFQEALPELFGKIDTYSLASAISSSIEMAIEDDEFGITADVKIEKIDFAKEFKNR